MADSRLHKPAPKCWLFVLRQCLKEVCSEQLGKTVPVVTLQKAPFTPLKGAAPLVTRVPNTAWPH